MVAPSPEREAELAELIREQKEDATQRRLGRSHVREVRAADIGGDFDLDRFVPQRASLPVILKEGIAQEWGTPASDLGCPVCHGRPGSSLCLRCNQWGDDDRQSTRGKVSSIGGPTTYAGDVDGLKGGKG